MFSIRQIEPEAGSLVNRAATVSAAPHRISNLPTFGRRSDPTAGRVNPTNSNQTLAPSRGPHLIAYFAIPAKSKPRPVSTRGGEPVNCRVQLRHSLLYSRASDKCYRQSLFAVLGRFISLGNPTESTWELAELNNCRPTFVLYQRVDDDWFG